MHNIFKSIRLKLQFHAEGASGGEGGDGAAPGDNSAAAAQVSDHLEELGIPKDKAEKYRARKAKQGAPAQAVQQAAAAEEPEPSAEVSQVSDDDAVWEEAKKNPVINKRMQDAVNARLKDFAKKNGDNAQVLQQLAPALELIGRKVGIDVSDISKLDVSAFVKAVNEDPSYFEDMAAEMGTTTEAARNVYNRERQARAAEQSAKEAREEAAFRQHYEGLVAQAEELKRNGYDGLSLEQELNDPWFVRVTSPSGGLSVKQALDAKYHDQIVKNREAAAAQGVQQAISKNMQSRGALPKEAGSTNRAAVPVQTKRYSEMSKTERDAYYKQMTGHDRRR